MWRKQATKQTHFRYAYEVDLIDKMQLRGASWNKICQYRNMGDEAEIWCDDNCMRSWSRESVRFYFDSKDDAMMFKLIWAGRIH